MKNIKEKIKIVVADRKKFLLDRRNWLIGQETLSAGKLRRKSIEWRRKQGKITQNQRKFYLLTSFTPPRLVTIKTCNRFAAQNKRKIILILYN